MQDQQPDKSPLSGLRVVSFEQAVAAPLCTRILRDLGADVIKIERVDGGDFARTWDDLAGGLSSYFVWLNRGKRSIALTTRVSKSREVLRRLIQDADVFVENAANATVVRLGLTYPVLATLNPRLVHCSISGYGQDGPYRDRKAYDLLVQAETGTPTLNGTEAEPAKVGLPVADIAAGMYAVQGILAALLSRQRTGVGRPVEVSLFDSMIDWLGGPLTTVANGGPPPKRTGLHHNMIVPYGPYRARDGKWVCIAVEHEREWESFCRHVIERPDLIEDPEYSRNASRLKHRSKLEAVVQEAFSCLDASEWQARLETAGLAYSNLNELPQVAQHPQVALRGLLESVELADGSQIVSTAPALRMDGYTPAPRPPHVGEHTDDVLAGIGYSRAEIDELRAEGAIN